MSASSSPQDQQPRARFQAPSVDEFNLAIGEKYEVLDLLGAGGMGAVYQARQPVLERLVAIKLLPPAADETGALNFSERFRREAKAMAQLDHPNIISVFDFGQTSGGLSYFVMEFVDGNDLHTLIHAAKLELSHVINWFPLICQALEYAHGKGIVHCDIKPANILIAKDGRVKVADFGLVQLRADPANGERALGTPVYSAPEVFDPNLAVDHRADIFSLGILMYELLTGRAPSGAWVPPSRINRAVDPRYDNLVLSCVQQDPAQRLQSASQVSLALGKTVATPAQSAPPARPPSPALVAGGATRAPRTGPPHGTVKRPTQRPVSPAKKPVGGGVAAPVEPAPVASSFSGRFKTVVILILIALTLLATAIWVFGLLDSLLEEAPPESAAAAGGRGEHG